MAKTKRGPVLLVTGASQGIGSAIARAFAADVAGVRLALVARNAANLTRVAAACRQAGAAEVEAFPCDVADEQSVAQMAAAVAQRFGPLDVLINNAGSFSSMPFDAFTVKEFDRLIAANLRSLFLVSRAFVPAMARRGRGDVFNMGSVAGLRVFAGGAGYSAAKFGVTGLSKVLREEYRAKGIRVTCVYPGATVSPSWKGSGVPPARMMPAEDVAQAFVVAYRLTRRTVVEEIVLRPQLGDL
jgi:short-subunit dehydrogenase